MASAVIADSDPFARNALALWLSYKLGIEVIYQFADGQGLIDSLRQDIPDLILMDWTLPGKPSPGFCRALQEKNPGLCWLILSSDPDSVESAKAYSEVFFLKGSPLDRITEIVQGVVNKSSANQNPGV